MFEMHWNRRKYVQVLPSPASCILIPASCILILVLSLSNCVTLGNLCTLSELQFPHLSGRDDVTYHKRLM